MIGNTQRVDDARVELYDIMAGEESFDRKASQALELQRTTKDGDPVRISVSTAPIRDDSGSVTGVVAVARDVTDEREWGGLGREDSLRR